MQTLSTLIFTGIFQPDGECTLRVQLVGTLRGIEGKVSASDIEVLLAYLSAVKSKIEKEKLAKGE